MQWKTLSQPRELTAMNARFSEGRMTDSLSREYAGRVAAGELHHDAAQEAVVARLDALARELVDWNRGRRGLRRLFGGRAPAPKGLYIHGSVGRGKTMLMDLFFASVNLESKQRVHFHEFMADVHERIGEARKSAAGDPIPLVAEWIANETRLLCFDELHVTDIADAMILGRLFKVLFGEEVVVVATSNAHPTDLYKNGLNRQLFVPFIDLIGQHMEVLELDSAKDFRLEKLSGRPLYFTPVNADAVAGMDALWSDMTGGANSQSFKLEVKGREVVVPRAAMGIARFNFDDLCVKPLGSLDYLAIARAFHTVMIDGIPVLTRNRRNEARRLINLIDTLYDNRINLIVSAEAEPDGIYVEGDGVELFARTASRLIEMRSEEYLSLRGERLAEAAQANLESAK